MTKKTINKTITMIKKACKTNNITLSGSIQPGTYGNFNLFVKRDFEVIACCAIVKTDCIVITNYNGFEMILATPM